MQPPLFRLGRDSIAEFEAAAEQRHTEARHLLRRSRDLGAIYLYGYSIELRLKAAYFATRGVRSTSGVPFGPTDQISDADRNTAMREWSVLGLLRKANNGHDLEFWGALTVAKRAASGRPYPTWLGSAAVAKASDVYAEWRETLRYRATPPRPGLVRLIRDRADWFARHYPSLVA